jgi:hypothetical protein
LAGKGRGDRGGGGEEFDGGGVGGEEGVFCGGEFEGMVVGCGGGLDEDGAVQARTERGGVVGVKGERQVGAVEA